MELDQLKKIWKNENNHQNYDDTSLLKILNKKSTNYVKYILWISIAEFCIVALINIFSSIYRNQSERFFSIFTKYHIPFTDGLMSNYTFIFNLINYSTFIISFLFIYLFYKSYKSIKIESSLKHFIQQIVNVRKTVNVFIYLNLGLIVLVNLFFVVYPIYLVISGEISLNKEVYTLLGIFIASIVMSFLSLYVYYNLIYGIVLNKLKSNLRQLKKIEQTIDLFSDNPEM